MVSYIHFLLHSQHILFCVVLNLYIKFLAEFLSFFSNFLVKLLDLLDSLWVKVILVI
jgi:hypothetical protein